MSSLAVRRVLSTFAAAGLAAVLAGGAEAQSLFGGGGPAKPVDRDLIRRVLLDTCVYGEAAKDDAKKEKVVDACQCASFKAMKPLKKEEVDKITAVESIPDDWYKATTEAYATCVR